MKSGAPFPVVVVLDIFALIAGRTRDWEAYSRVGTCYVPQVVYREIEFLCDRAPEPAQEQVAREFVRFWPKSGWQLTSAHTPHPSLQPAASAQTSQQARLVVAVAQCVYGVSQEQPGKLVVFVSTSLSLLKRMQSLGVPNLSCITSTALLQWARTGHRPPAVTQQLQALKDASAAAEAASSLRTTRDTHSAFTKSERTNSKLSSTGLPASLSSDSSLSSASRLRTPKSSDSSLSGASRLRTPKSAAPPASYRDKSEPVYIRQTPRSVAKVRSFKPGVISSVFSGAIALVALLLAVGFAWRLAQPASFDVFWQKQVMPVWRQKVVPAIPSQMRQQFGIK